MPTAGSLQIRTCKGAGQKVSNESHPAGDSIHPNNTLLPFFVPFPLSLSFRLPLMAIRGCALLVVWQIHSISSCTKTCACLAKNIRWQLSTESQAERIHEWQSAQARARSSVLSLWFVFSFSSCHVEVGNPLMLQTVCLTLCGEQSAQPSQAAMGGNRGSSKC